MTTTQRTKSGRRAAHRAAPVLALTLALTLAVSLLAGCDPEPEVTTQDQCDELLDKGFWDAAITTCSQIMTDEGYSKTAQAYMGRAGITVLDLIRKIESNANLAGLALILNAFTVTPAEFADVEQAIAFMQLIVNFTNTDYFNIIVASDVALATLLKNELLITIDATTGVMTIPGITDSGLDTLSSTSTPAQIQTALDGIYGDPALDDTYYATPPPVWNNPGDVTDLSRVSSFVQANAIGSSAIALGALTDLDFAGQIDNGECGMPAAATASAFTLAHGTLVVGKFPRRLNTSDATAGYLADELQFVLFNNAGAVDSAREWAGTFTLPSRLLNPDHVGINCGAVLAVDAFTTCMGGPMILASAVTARTESDLTTLIGCDGTCGNWPILNANGNVLTDEYGAQGDDAKTDLAGVLHQLYPVDNTDPLPGTSGLHCVAGDGWVHAREYDFYLRSFGQ